MSTLGDLMTSVFLIAATLAALADDMQPPISVTAARVPETASAAQSLTVFDATRIESLNLPQLTELIRLMPGVSVSSSGPIGSLTDIRIRGAEANHTLTFVDGIEVNDPAAGNATQFGTLTADNVSRLELLRGAQSALWGAEALGGVVAITTPDPVNGTRAYAQGEYGSHDSRRLSAGASAGTDKAGVSLNTAWLKTDGIDALGQGGERDGFENLTLNGKAIARPTPDGELGLSARYTRAETAFDTDFPRAQSSKVLRVETHAVHGWATYGIGADAPWTLSLNGTLIDSENRNRDGANALGETSGQRVRMGAQATHRFGIGGSDQRLTIAMEDTFESFKVDDIAGSGRNSQRRTRENIAYVAEWRGRIGEMLDMGAAIRHDDNNRFKNATTVKADAALNVGEGFRIHGGYGEGFAQPTMFDLFGFDPSRFIGNPNLKPERGWNAEAGIGWSNNVIRLDLTGFTGRLKDEIVFASDFMSMENASGKSRRKGLEATMDARPLDWLRLSASYSYVDARQQDLAGAALVREVRRPKHSAAFSADASWNRLSGGFGLSYTGARIDTDFDNFPAVDVRLKSYLLASLNLAYKLTDAVELYVRGANLFNDRYRDVLHTATEGRTVYGGIRMRFGR
mgnify:CR=1 FL=1